MAINPSHMRARCGWESDFPTFSEVEPRVVRISLEEFLADASDSQVFAWDDSIPKLQHEVAEVVEIDDDADTYTAILEYELPMESRRPDVVLLVSGAVVVLELKGKQEAEQPDLDQAAAYARDLRCYHKHCAEREVHAVVVPTRAHGYEGVRDGVHVTGPDALHELVQRLQRPWPAGPLTAEQFLAHDAYCPLPTLVQAARELFLEGNIRPIHRARAYTDPAVEAIARIAHEAARTRTRHLVLVTGVPGSGKTLVGLRAVHNPALDDLAKERVGGKPTAPAIFLSGNGPLVQVLQYELRSAGGGGKTFVRDVKNYVKQYLGDKKAIPPHHVIVYDEAQRAWDVQQVAAKHALPFPRSEPEAFVEFGERIPGWCVLVGLIGSGQEIHVGEEAGLGQWREALDHADMPEDWTVHAPKPVLDQFFSTRQARERPAAQREANEDLDLKVELRFHFADDLDQWVDGLLADDREWPAHEIEEHSRELAADGRELMQRLESDGYHLRMTRNLEDAKAYFPKRYEGDLEARYGLLASSRDKALAEWDVPNDWHSTQRLSLGAWYGAGDDDVRSCRHLRECVTEFGAQGLELDGVLLAWGTDLVRNGSKWSNTHAKRHARASHVRDPFQLRLNAYRVLLTRGRNGCVIFVPPIEELDETAAWLQEHGVKLLGAPTWQNATQSALTPKPSKQTVLPLARRDRHEVSVPAQEQANQHEHVLDDVTYVWTGSRWYQKHDFLTPPTSVLRRLDKLVPPPQEEVPEQTERARHRVGRSSQRDSRASTIVPVIGDIPSVPVGTVFPSRKALREAGIHRPLQAGICGSSDTGAESIVLNGGYEDDVDTAEEIIYTGHGGNDPATRQQVADQTLTKSNLALVRSSQLNRPVRVVRGWRTRSGLGPKSGYRYEGLYQVTEHWQERGRSGHKIWRYRLVPLQKPAG